MTDIEARKAEIEGLIRTANTLDDAGSYDLADQVTRVAKAAAEKLEDDVDANEAESPVDGGDPMAKGFGKSVATLAKKISSVCGANNCHKKLEQLCEAKDVDCDADELFMCLRKANKMLGKLVG